jgi:hypothetical protein
MTVPAPLGQVFQFFEDPGNLARITPVWLSVRIVDPDAVRMREGAEIDYVIRWWVLPLKWRTLIARYAPPFSFVDEQVRGPYRYWHHEHTFEATPEGIAIRDRVDYALPLGILGRLAHALIVKRQLLAIFRFRQAAIAGILGVEGVAFDAPVIGTLSS